jgi:hypothetical protein
LWNNDQEPETSEKDWDSVAEEGKKAANVLGFNRKKWDTDGSITPDFGYNNFD